MNPRQSGGDSSLFCLDLTGLAAHLGLELGREVVWTLEVQPIGHLLDAEVTSGKEFLGTEESQLLLEGGGRETRILLEQLTEVAIAYA